MLGCVPHTHTPLPPRPSFMMANLQKGTKNQFVVKRWSSVGDHVDRTCIHTTDGSLTTNHEVYCFSIHLSK